MGRHPNGSCASSRVTVSRGVPWQPHRRHQSSGSTTRQASTARSGSSSWPVTSRPRPSRRVKVVRSGRVKVASGTSRSFGWLCVGTSIFGRPRHLPPDRRASADYTLICEEPRWRLLTVHRDGSVSVQRHRDGRRSKPAHVTLPAGYVDQHVQLG